MVKLEQLICISRLKKDILVPSIFTRLQFNTLKKRLAGKRLTKNEQAYYYKFIKPKIKAALSLSGNNEFFIKGIENILPGRGEKAEEIIRALSRKHRAKRIMVSGSFLFSRKFNDIDVFVISKYRKEDYKKGRIHINFLPESALGSLFFSSIAKISISNFRADENSGFKLSLRALLHNYEVLVSYIVQGKTASDELRKFILESEYAARGVVLSPKHIYEAKIRMENKSMVSNTLINSVILGYGIKEIKKEVLISIRDYSKILSVYKNAENIKEYINTYEKVVELAA